MKTTELAKPPLLLSGDGFRISTTKEALRLKHELCDAAEGIVMVEDHPGALLAKETRDSINEVLKAIEKNRKEVKSPILKAGDTVDDAAKAYVLELKQAMGRIDGLLGDFARAEDVKRQEALRIANERAMEAQRVEQERIRKDEEAERLRIGAENAAAEAETAKQRREAAVASAVALSRQQQADELMRQTVLTQQESYHFSQVAAQSRVAGVRAKLDYTVLDIKALAAVRPDLVEFTAKRRDILSELNRLADEGLPVYLPGLEIREDWRVR